MKGQRPLLSEKPTYHFAFLSWIPMFNLVQIPTFGSRAAWMLRAVESKESFGEYVSMLLLSLFHELTHSSLVEEPAGIICEAFSLEQANVAELMFSERPNLGVVLSREIVRNRIHEASTPLVEALAAYEASRNMLEIPSARSRLEHELERLGISGDPVDAVASAKEDAFLLRESLDKQSLEIYDQLIRLAYETGSERLPSDVCLYALAIPRSKLSDFIPQCPSYANSVERFQIAHEVLSAALGSSSLRPIVSGYDLLRWKSDSGQRELLGSFLDALSGLRSRKSEPSEKELVVETLCPLRNRFDLAREWVQEIDKLDDLGLGRSLGNMVRKSYEMLCPFFGSFQAGKFLVHAHDEISDHSVSQWLTWFAGILAKDELLYDEPSETWSGQICWGTDKIADFSPKEHIVSVGGKLHEIDWSSLSTGPKILRYEFAETSKRIGREPCVKAY